MPTTNARPFLDEARALLVGALSPDIAEMSHMDVLTVLDTVRRGLDGIRRKVCAEAIQLGDGVRGSATILRYPDDRGADHKIHVVKAVREATRMDLKTALDGVNALREKGTPFKLGFVPPENIAALQQLGCDVVILA